MTENRSRDEQTKKKQEGVINTLENSARWTVNKLNSVLGSVGIPKIDTDGLLEAIKAGTIAPNSIVGAAEEMLKLMAGTLKAASSAAKKVPYIGKIIAAAIKLTGKSLIVASHLVDRVKDACVDLAVSNLAWQVGNLQDGLNDVKNKVDKQGKAMEEGFAKAKQALADAKSELKGDIEKQGKEFKEAMDEMDSMMNEFKSQTAKNLAHIEGEIEGLKIEQNRQASQLFDQKLEFGRLERELTDKMKSAEKNVEFARQELTEHREALNKAENRIDRSIKEGQHQWEEFQGEWQHRESILKNRVENFQDQVNDFQQEQMNVRREQDQINRNFAEIEEEFEQQGLLLSRHIDRVSRMADDMEEITTEMNKRMDRIQKSQLEQDEKIEEINYTVKKATKEVKERLEKQDRQIDNLTEQMKENQEKVKQAKAEADKANERIDNLLTNQVLSDFSSSEQVSKKLEKVFEQKTEEAKLLTSLETLKKVRKEIPTVENEQEWLVGIQKGTESQLPRSEGYPLIIPQRWIKKYGWTAEELREWGWDVRMKGEHETAPLTDEEKRQEQRTSEQQQTSDKPKELTEQQEAYLQKIEDTKAEILSKLVTIQEQINSSVEQIETAEKREESEEELDALEDELTTPSKKLAQELGKDSSQVQQSLKIKWEEFKKQAQVATGTKKPVNQPEPQISETAQKMIKSVALQTEIEALEEQKKQAQEDYHAKKQKREQLEEFIETKKKEIESQVESSGEAGDKQAKETSEEVKDLEELLEQAKKEEAKLEQDIEKKEQEQQDKKEELEKTDPTKELEKELEKELSATQKTMTFAFLLIIIFLLEYIVYKRNGLPGLVVLNVILGIIYYYKDTLKEYWKYVDKYLLIIAYIMGNALAYHAVEKPQYKWTAVIVYNTIIAAIFGYSWWQTNNISQKIKDKIDEFTTEQEKVLEQVQKEQEEFKKQEEEREVEETKQRLEALQKLEEISHSIAKPTRTIQNNLEVNQKFLEMAEERQEGYTKVIKAFEEAIEELKKEEQLIDKNINSTQKGFLNQWKEISRQGFSQKELKEIKKRAKNSLLNHVPITTHGVTQKTMTREEWQKIITPLILEMEETSETSNNYQFAKEKFNNLLQKTEIIKEDQGLLKKISKLLSKEQIISISAQSSTLQTFIQGEILDKKKGLTNKLEKRYNQFSEKEKLTLLSLGLKGVGIVNNEQKNQLLNILSSIETEKGQWFNYTQKGNQKLGEFLFEGLNLTPEQEETLQSLGLEAVGVNPDWKPTPQQKNQILNKIIRPLISSSLENSDNKRKKFINLELPKSTTDKWQIKIGESQTISLPVSEEQKLSLFPLTQKEEKLLKSIAPTYLKTIKFPITLLQQIYSLGLEEKQLNFLENSEVIPNTKTDFIDKYERHLENSYKEFKSELLKPIYQEFKIGQEEQEKNERWEFLVKHQSNYRLLLQTLQEEIFTENIRKFHGVLLPLYSDNERYSWDELLFPQRIYQIKTTPAGIFLDTQFLGLQISQKYHLIDVLLITFVYQDWITKQERLLEIAREELELKKEKNKLFDLLPGEVKKSWLEREEINSQILGSWKDFKNYLEREIVTYENEQVVIRPERLEDYISSPELEKALDWFCDSLDATLDNQEKYHQLPTWESKNWEELIPYEKALFGFKTNQKRLELKVYQQLGLIYQGYLTTKQTETLLASENEKKIIQQIELLEEKLRQLQTETVNCQRTITIQNILTNSELVELFVQFLQNSFEFPDKEWEEWKDISPEFNQELVEFWQKWDFDYWQTQEWISIGLNADDYSYAYWLEREGFEPEWVLNEGDEATLQETFKESKENETELVILSVFEKKIKQLLIDYQICQKKKGIEKVLRREEIRKLMEGQGGGKSSLSEEIKSMFEVLQEQLERKLTGKPAISPIYTTTSQSTISQPSAPQPKETEKTAEEDDADLPDWLKKQRERKRRQLEEDRKQLEQDRKITEQKAKEAEEKSKLQEQEREQRKIEEEERRKRQEAEMEELKKRKLDELETIAKNTETEAKRAQDKLDAFIEEEELKKQRMEQKIKDLKAETEAKEKAYAEQETVLKEQHQKELEALAADDKEKRQTMEKEFQAMEQDRQRKHLEEMRKIDDEIKRKEDELDKKHLENQRKVEQMEKEADLAVKEAERAKEDTKKTKEAYEKHKRETEEKDRRQKEEQDVIDKKTREERSKIFKLDQVQEKAIDLISEHQPIEYDMEKGSLWYNKPVVTKFSGRSYWRVRQYWLNCPGIKFNPYRWHKTEEIESHVKTSDGSTYIPGIRDKWITSISVWLGDGWFTKEEMIERLKQIDRTNFFD